MKRIFESGELKEFIEGLSLTHVEYNEAMATDLRMSLRGTIVKKHPSMKIMTEEDEFGVYFPVELVCHTMDENTKIIPVCIAPNGLWGGIRITRESLIEVTGDNYDEDQDGNISLRVLETGRDFTEVATMTMDNFQKESIAMA